MTAARCPHCGGAVDLLGRITGDVVWHPACEQWYRVGYDLAGPRLTRADPPARYNWPSRESERTWRPRRERGKRKR